MEQYLKKPLVLAVSAGVLAAAVSFAEHKVSTEGDFEPDMSRYFKIALLVALCTYGAISVLKMQCPMKGGGVVESNVTEVIAPPTAPWTGSEANRGSVSDQIHTGNPNF
jgi:hypothetical protein